MLSLKIYCLSINIIVMGVVNALLYSFSFDGKLNPILILKNLQIKGIPYLENHYQRETHLQQKFSKNKQSITTQMTTSSKLFDNNIFTFDSDDQQQLENNIQDSPHQPQHLIKHPNINTMPKTHSQIQTNQTNIFVFQEDEKDLNFIRERKVTPFGTNTQIVDIKPRTKNTDAGVKTESIDLNNNHALNQQLTVNYKLSLTQSQNTQQHLNKQNTVLPHPPSYSIQGAKILTPDSHPSKQYQYVEEQKAIKVTNLKQFLFTQLSPQYKINVVIKKADEGFFDKIVSKTKYYVTIEENNKFLFSVTKEGFNKLIFSMSKDDPSPKNKNYLGQLLGRDFSNTQFLLFDDGFDPEQTKSLQFSYKQLGWVKYEQSSGPRRFSVTISTNNKGFHCIEKDGNIIERKWREGKDSKSLCRLQSKEPVLDESDGNFKLDFRGMIGKPSVKNFVLYSEEFDGCLIFARRSDNTYGVEVKNPFSLIQAVGICMASIYHKVVF